MPRLFGLGLLAMSLAACGAWGDGGPQPAGAAYYAYIA